MRAALFTLADFAQVVPGIDAAGVAVIPGDVQGIFTHRLYFFGPGRLFVHRQQGGGLFGRLTRIAMVGVAFFSACGAWAGVTQPLEGEVRAMAVVPLDVHSRAGGDVDFDGLGVDHGHMNKYIQNPGTRFALTQWRTNGKV